MDSSAPLATFERIAESIRSEIRSGALKPGDKLPPHRELAAAHGVAVATLQNALRHLQDEGWLTSRASVGVFVNQPPAASETIDAVNERVAELQAVVADLAERVQKIESHQNAT